MYVMLVWGGVYWVELFNILNRVYCCEVRIICGFLMDMFLEEVVVVVMWNFLLFLYKL